MTSVRLCILRVNTVYLRIEYRGEKTNKGVPKEAEEQRTK